MYFKDHTVTNIFILLRYQGYLTSIGSRVARTRAAVEHFLAPVTHGAVSTFLGILMLAFSPFDFVFK